MPDVELVRWRKIMENKPKPAGTPVQIHPIDVFGGFLVIMGLWAMVVWIFSL